MKSFNSTINEYAGGKNTKLYEFLATNYDISGLAAKIHAEKYAKISILNLKKLGGGVTA